MKSILDPTFQYVPSYATDISLRFAAIKKARQDARKEAGKDTEKIVDIFNSRRAEAADERR